LAIPLDTNGKIEIFCLWHQVNFEMNKFGKSFLKIEKRAYHQRKMEKKLK
jgi:hypothetical protein